MKFTRILMTFSSVLLGSTLAFSATPQKFLPEGPKADEKSVVLVHGAFADGSSWIEVIPFLHARGIKVVSVQNPLTSLADDTAAAKRAIDNQPGKVILAGHSWGGMAITEAGGHDKVAALVYVAAFAPDVGESALDLSAKFAPAPGFSFVKPDAAGYAYLSEEGFEKHFGQDLAPERTKVLAAVQGPIAVKCFDEKATVAGWKGKPTWYVVAENDDMIRPDLQRELVTKISATSVSLPASHVVMISKAKEVADVIIAAFDSVK